MSTLLKNNAIRSSFGHKLSTIRRLHHFRLSHHRQYHSLTSREKQVLKLLLQDFNNPQIAKKLHISRSTVEQHRKNMNKKLGVNTYCQLFWYGLSFDLI